MGIALTIIAYDTRLASLTSFEEQETGMNFEQMLEKASEELQAVMKGFAPSSESALQRVYESTLTQTADLRKRPLHDD